MNAAQPAAGAEPDEQVLAIVAGLMSELSGGAPHQPALDDSLDRDLGISSLERVELLLRLERAFGVRLPDVVMAEAATPRDLVAALRRGTPGGPAAPAVVRQAPAVDASVPTASRTLVDALRWHADRSPDRVHVHLRTDDDRKEPITYGALLSAAMAMGSGLREIGIGAGDRVALMLRTERAFFDTFMAALLIGAVPVPLYPPLRAEDLVAYTRRQERILTNSGARVLVAFAQAERLASLIRGQVPSLEMLTTPDRLARSATPAPVHRPSPSDPALIQYTSGSTGDPKGVLLSHANLLANIRGIGDALAIGPTDAGVSWLPLYHDMGLIGMWLGAMYFGVPVALMSPLAFLSRPSRWLWAIHEHRATISAAPNFAFDLCARKVADEEIPGLDLSSWRVAINGSEAVSPDTIGRFLRRFAPYGLSAHAMCPAYGLAESSVALTLAALDRPPRVDRIARAPFERTRAIEPAPPDDAGALRFVSCGRPLNGHEVVIVDRSGRQVGDRVDGHIRFRGPSMTAGYFGNPAATRAVVHEGWMDSGDLGYLADGELFITGREKDLIIQGGRNICAEEVETLASSVPGIRPGCVAAFGVPDPQSGTERVVVVAEAREMDPARREAIRRMVRDRIVSGIGSPPDLVVIAGPRTVLKTPSGKIRRGAMRDAYLAGTLGARSSVAEQRARLFAADAWSRARRAADWLRRAIFTAWVAIVLALTLPALWALLRGRGPGRHAGRTTRRWARLALTLCGVRPRVVGLEHLCGTPAAVMVANHASYIDSIVLMAAIADDFHFVAKRALLEHRLIGTVIEKAEFVTIEKAGVADRLAGADAVAQRLREGDRLMIFPEGTFFRAPGLLPFRLGAFRAAVDTGRPVVPIAIAGTRRVLPDGTWLFRHGPIEVTIGEPMVPAGSGWPEMVRLRDASLAFIAAHCGERPITP